MLFLFYGFLVFNKYCIATNPNNNPIIIKKKDKSTIIILFSKAKIPFKIKNTLAISSKIYVNLLSFITKSPNTIR